MRIFEEGKQPVRSAQSPSEEPSASQDLQQGQTTPSSQPQPDNTDNTENLDARGGQEEARSVQEGRGVQVVIEQELYSLSLSPTPSIFWKTPGPQKSRSFTQRGDITCHKRDGSIHIYKTNGDVSVYREGRWHRHTGTGEGALLDGHKQISIRDDQTIFVREDTGLKIIFPDGTQIYNYVQGNRVEIKSRGGPLVRIHLGSPTTRNIIGHGSAFAYLGFQNLLQRSYDDYMFEVIDSQISCHSYLEVFERDGAICQERVRVISHRDSSIFRINETSKEVVYVSPNPHSLLTPETLSDRWLEAFSEQGSQGEGVFWVNLREGFIYNKDSEGNKFKAMVTEPSHSEIAVSFIRQGGEEGRQLPNGFHIEEENYFLPLPNNRIPPRLFCISHDGSGAEFLSRDQIGPMGDWTLLQEFEAARRVTQYTRENKRTEGYLESTFSAPVNLDVFGLPNILTSFQTYSELRPPFFNDIQHRVIREVAWDSDFSNLKRIEEELNCRAGKRKANK